jgi:nucleoside-diphosphate-sugar epimerase
MLIALTGATGFLGRYLAERLAGAGHALRCWYRSAGGIEALRHLASSIEWVQGDLSRPNEFPRLLDGCDAVVHAGLFRPSGSFRGDVGNLEEYLELNLMGSIRLIEAAQNTSCRRFVFISSCAVHEKILEDRPLDEAHPLWPLTHYGAYKAAVEAFVHSFGMGTGFPVCALRPTGIYGLARPVEQSKWYSIVRAVAKGKSVTCTSGGKEVHASDVARAADLLLSADGIAGESFNCYDRYISEYEVASLAKSLTGSGAEILGRATTPKHQIETGKIRSLGMTFAGAALLEETVRAMLAHRE